MFFFFSTLSHWLFFCWFSIALTRLKTRTKKKKPSRCWMCCLFWSFMFYSQENYLSGVFEKNELPSTISLAWYLWFFFFILCIKGPECSLDINECVSHPCKNGGTCIDQLGNYYCRCAAPFKGNEDWGSGVKGEEKQS